MSYNQLDFDEVKEYEQFLSVERMRLCELIRSVTKLNPQAMMGLGVQGVDALIALSYDQTSVGKNPIGCTQSSLYYKAIESGCLFFHAIFSGLQKLPAETLAPIVPAINIMLQKLLAFPQNDPLCLTKILDPVVDGSLLVREHHACLTQVINRVMGFVSFSSDRVPVEQLSTLQKEITSNLRRKASCCLVKLAEGFSDQFVPFYKQLFSQIQLLLDSPMIGLSERTFLMEFL